MLQSSETLEDQLRSSGVQSDSLTGLANHRRRYSKVLHAEIHGGSSRTSREFSLILLDLDGLKGINDQFGHPYGRIGRSAGSGRFCEIAAVPSTPRRATEATSLPWCCLRRV